MAKRAKKSEKAVLGTEPSPTVGVLPGGSSSSGGSGSSGGSKAGRDGKPRGATKSLRALGSVPPAPPERWKEQPDEHDYPAARNYLSLLLSDSAAEQAVAVLERAPLVRRQAKDLLRASRLPLLSSDNPAVARDLAKVAAGGMLSPVLALRGRLGTDVPLTIADGYHRICASYHLSEDAAIPCRLGDVARR